jgi:hypothetical protein
MKHIRTAGLLVLVALAALLVASTSALAAPGVTENGNPITGATFSGSGGATVLKAAGGTEVKCTATSTNGKITSLTQDVATIKFTGCKSNAGSKCFTTSGEEIVAPVSSKIVEAPSGSTKAGLLVEPRLPSTGANEIEFKCGTLTIKVKGSVIGNLGEGSNTTFLANYELTANGKENTLKDTANPLLTSVSGGSFEASTQSGTGKITFTLTVKVEG